MIFPKFTRPFLLLALPLAILLVLVSSPSDPLAITPAFAQTGEAKTPEITLADALKNLDPKDEEDCGLLLGFDTDTSKDAAGYAQFYDDFSKEEKTATNKTYYFIRKGGRIALSAKLNYIASPQKNGFLYLGQARYFEPRPRDKNVSLDRWEEEGSLKNFGFDYTRIWQTSSKSLIPAAKKQVLRKTKAGIDAEYKKLSAEDREYHRNITDYEKIGFITDRFYVADGFWSLVHGGAAWFEANTKNDVVSLSGQKVSGRLKDHYSTPTINSGFAEVKERFGENRWLGEEKIGYVRNSTFTLERHAGKTHLVGLIMVDGNLHRSFHEGADFGTAPRSLIIYDNPAIDFEKFKTLYPTLLDIFVSPGQSTVYALTEKDIIGIDVKTAQEIFRTQHNLLFNKVIMVEWATSHYVDKWQHELNSKK